MAAVAEAVSTHRDCSPLLCHSNQSSINMLSSRRLLLRRQLLTGSNLPPNQLSSRQQLLHGVMCRRDAGSRPAMRIVALSVLTAVLPGDIRVERTSGNREEENADNLKKVQDPIFPQSRLPAYIEFVQ